MEIYVKLSKIYLKLKKEKHAINELLNFIEIRSKKNKKDNLTEFFT